MPKEMLLKSDGFASNLSAPAPNSSLADYCRERGLPYHPTDLPVPIRTFVDYGLDFQRRFVPDVEDRVVTSVGRDGRRFRVRLDDGEELDAGRVVVAAGLTHFAVMPEGFVDLPTDRVTHSSAHHDLAMFNGKDVTVIGAGSSAVDLVVALTAAGSRDPAGGTLTCAALQLAAVRSSSKPVRRLRKPRPGSAPDGAPGCAATGPICSGISRRGGGPRSCAATWAPVRRGTSSRRSTRRSRS